jgi:hypothetical protein
MTIGPHGFLATVGSVLPVLERPGFEEFLQSKNRMPYVKVMSVRPSLNL